MELVAIEGSSNVAAVGYLPDVCLLRVRFWKDKSQSEPGETYDWLNISAQAHASLMSAPSKGKWIREHLTGGTRFLGGDTIIKLREPGTNEPDPEPEPLETFGEDSCCSKRLAIADRSGSDTWVCPKCGCEWRAHMVDKIRMWQPYDEVMIWNRQ